MDFRFRAVFPDARVGQLHGVVDVAEQAVHQRGGVLVVVGVEAQIEELGRDGGDDLAVDVVLYLKVAGCRPCSRRGDRGCAPRAGLRR